MEQDQAHNEGVDSQEDGVSFEATPDRRESAHVMAKREGEDDEFVDETAGVVDLTSGEALIENPKRLVIRDRWCRRVVFSASA